MEIDVTAIGEGLITKLRSHHKQVGVWRFYHEGVLLVMNSGKFQWSTQGAALNALHNMVDDFLHETTGQWYGWQVKDAIYGYVRAKVELRQVTEE